MSISRFVRRVIPDGLRRAVQRAAYLPAVRALRAWMYRGDSRYCPVCETMLGRFAPFGVPRREEAECPRCGALERDRLLWAFLRQRPELFEGAPRMLHLAPEPALERRFRSVVGQGYVSGDISNPRAMARIDVTDIPYPDGAFDIVYCSHVLEHVEDDRRAMRELRRVLADDGWAILLVPIKGETTYEDPSITTAAGREKAFGQWDHVRFYGRDYVDRLRASGFEVDVSYPSDVADEPERVRLGLTAAAGEIFFCRPSRR